MNTKEEFLEHIKGKSKIICATIYFKYKECYYILKEGHTKTEFVDFYTSLDFEYDNGFGGQELYGIILFENSYSDRWEYDGSEGWRNNKKPTPEEVMNYKFEYY